jgi:hypothetical protein
MGRQRTVGFVLVLLGGLWAYLTNHGTRSSKLGLVAGCMLILSGLFRIWTARSGTPEA